MDKHKLLVAAAVVGQQTDVCLRLASDNARLPDELDKVQLKASWALGDRMSTKKESSIRSAAASSRRQP
jgi:hypothetical protein